MTWVSDFSFWSFGGMVVVKTRFLLSWALDLVLAFDLDPVLKISGDLLWLVVIWVCVSIKS